MRTLLYVQLLFAVFACLASSSPIHEESSHAVDFYEITEDGDEIYLGKKMWEEFEMEEEENEKMPDIMMGIKRQESIKNYTKFVEQDPVGPLLLKLGDTVNKMKRDGSITEELREKLLKLFIFNIGRVEYVFGTATPTVTRDGTWTEWFKLTECVEGNQTKARFCARNWPLNGGKFCEHSIGAKVLSEGLAEQMTESCDQNNESE